MARPQKSGVDYFPLDCNTDERTFGLLEAEYGITGFAVVIKLLQWIYKDEGYFIKWDKDVALMFSKRIGEGVSVVSEIVNCALRRQIFSEEKYKLYGILTSAGIQRRYLDMVKRRQSVFFEKEYLLVNVTDYYFTADINEVNVYINSKYVDSGTQSKVKKSKLKKSKVKNGNIYEAHADKTDEAERTPYGEYMNVLLSDEEYEALRAKYPCDILDRIDSLSRYMKRNSKNYPNHCAALQTWKMYDET